MWLGIALRFLVGNWKGILVACAVAFGGYLLGQAFLKGMYWERGRWESRLDRAVKDRLQELRENAALDSERGALAAARNKARQEITDAVRRTIPKGGPVVIPRDLARRLHDQRRD